ncbi:hypothetical protein, partial [Streptomyces sp. NPDC047868]|uniref:hypothetical protein n=1 Tax=Streptomyces sp. NPDC047868 TaxID=3155480 RepID=UPI00345433C2
MRSRGFVAFIIAKGYAIGFGDSEAVEEGREPPDVRPPLPDPEDCADADEDADDRSDAPEPDVEDPAAFRSRSRSDMSRVVHATPADSSAPTVTRAENTLVRRRRARRPSGTVGCGRPCSCGCGSNGIVCTGVGCGTGDGTVASGPMTSRQTAGPAPASAPRPSRCRHHSTI